MSKLKVKNLLILIVVIIVILIICLEIYNCKFKYSNNNEKNIYNTNGMIVNLIEQNGGGVEVKGINSEVIEDYLNGILYPFGHSKIEIAYKNQPTINKINEVLEKTNFKIDKEAEKYYTNIYNIIENSNDQVKNAKIINNIINEAHGSDLTYRSEKYIKEKTLTTTIQGQHLEELNNNILSLQECYLEGFNRSPI